MDWGPANLDLDRPLSDYDSMLLNSIVNNTEFLEEGMQSETPKTLMSPRSRSDLLLSEFSNDPDTFTQQHSDPEFGPTCQQIWPIVQASQPSQIHGGLLTMSPISPESLNASVWMSHSQQHAQWNHPHSPLSPFSVDQQMITRSNNHLTSANLLQIYHDVLEHNLSCWLNEMTCPYQTRSGETIHVAPEWGSSWSNRIYQRTIKLDRVAQSCKLLQLTRSEDQAASKALHLAVMAFATQWAQGSHRHREKYSAKSVDLSEHGIADGVAEEFDRTLQHHFWDQAQRALQQVADLESYRVVCAELIFGLTQKPWDSYNKSHGQCTQAEGLKFASEMVMAQLRDVIHKEGPPVYMERAARKIHSLKYRCDALEKGMCGNRLKGKPGAAVMSYEDRETIGLLYWLAIMFDTISSSMNERPVVVVDQDCEDDWQKETQQTANLDESFRRSRWDLNLLMQGNLEETHQTHWPCSYEAAAQDVIKSAPVKVLLFRHLSYLQNVVRKCSDKEKIEDIIRSTNSVYEYWSKTHGAFFAQLVQDYSAVPQRIQGWFVCISAHWHLAALMLADLLDFVDASALGTEDASCKRATSQMAGRIRRHSASELSDLARVGTPPIRSDSLGAPQMSDFHHAINEGTLLIEPWTMILIRAFTKACMVLINEADESWRITLEQNSPDFKRDMAKAEYCVKGLWLLGKKSDMAREVAEILSVAVRRVWKERAV